MRKMVNVSDLSGNILNDDDHMIVKLIDNQRRIFVLDAHREEVAHLLEVARSPRKYTKSEANGHNNEA